MAKEIKSLDDLRPGDILLFLPYETMPDNTRLIRGVQQIFNSESPYNDITHAGIYVQTLAPSRHMIKHVSAYEHRLRHEPLEDMYQRINFRRRFLVFRPKCADFSQALMTTIEATANVPVAWKTASAASSIFVSADDQPKASAPHVTQDSHCSRWVAEMIAMAQTRGSGVASNRSTVSPAVLGEQLSTGVYEQLCFTDDENLFLEARKFCESYSFGRDEHLAINGMVAQLQRRHNLDDVEKAIVFLRQVLSFSLNHSDDFVVNLEKWSRQKGLYQLDEGLQTLFEKAASAAAAASSSGDSFGMMPDY